LALDGQHEPFRERVQVRAPRRQSQHLPSCTRMRSWDSNEESRCCPMPASLDGVDERAYLAPAAAMTGLPLTVQFLAAWIGTWIARHQERTIAYLKEENRALRDQLGTRVRLTDSERRRLARLGKALGRKTLQQVASIASPETILRWYRELVAGRYDG